MKRFLQSYAYELRKSVIAKSKGPLVILNKTEKHRYPTSPFCPFPRQSTIYSVKKCPFKTKPFPEFYPKLLLRIVDLSFVNNRNTSIACYYVHLILLTRDTSFERVLSTAWPC